MAEASQRLRSPDNRAAGNDIQTLTRAESTRTWLSSFCELESAQQCERLIVLLRGFRFSPKYTPDSLRAFTELTQAWYRIAENLALRYRRDPASVGADPDHFHRTMAELNFAFAEAYAGFVDEFKGTPSERAPREIPLAKMTALALFYFGEYAKSLYSKSQLPEVSFWQRVHSLYSLARVTGFVAERVALLGGDEVDVTCNELWLRIVMLATLSSGDLTPRQMERTDEWLCEWCARITVDPTYDPTLHVYYVDIGEAAGPRRITPGVRSAKACYLGTKDMHHDIAAARTRIVEDSMTSSIGWYAENPLKEYFELLDRLQRLWMFAPSHQLRRASERSRAEMGEELELVRGFPTVMAVVEGAAAGPSTPLDRYAIIDQSTTGFGLFSAIDKRRPLERMELIAVRPKDMEWQVGIVVRTTILPSHNGRITGVQLLARKAILLTIEPVACAAKASTRALMRAPRETPNPPDHNRAFFLVGDASKTQADSLLVPSGTYAPGEQFKIKTASHFFRIRINRVIQNGEGWKRIGFQVVEKIAIK